MKKSFKLSICIPTLNRSGFVVEELEHWKKVEKSKEIEILIIDDASEDDTKIRVGEVIKKSTLDIKYIRNKKRLGFDKNISSMIKYAKGDFVWLISDDDLPKLDSVSKILSVISKHPDLSLININYSRFDNLLKKITAKSMVGDVKSDILFEDKDEFFFKEIAKSYFQYLGTNVITMSSDIVNRKLWLESVKDKAKYFGHNFIHCFIIADMISKQEKIYFTAKPQVQYLSNNHRVWPNDIWKDYNNVFLDYLIELGFDGSKVDKMKRDQKKFEQREGVIKHPLYKIFYKLAQPLYARFQYLKSKIDL